MMIARGDQRASPQNGIVGLRLFDVNLAQAVQTVGKRPGENFRHIALLEVLPPDSPGIVIVQLEMAKLQVRASLGWTSQEAYPTIWHGP
jgi:hypothetical protein